MLTHPDVHANLVTQTVEEAGASGAELAIVQISNWDVAVSSEDYVATMRDLSARLSALGTRLLVISAPPTGDAEFSVQLDRLFEATAAIALGDPDGNLQVLDARPIWGTPGVVDLDGDGTPERKRDLMHVCPSGAARFVAWLTDQTRHPVRRIDPQRSSRVGGRTVGVRQSVRRSRRSLRTGLRPCVHRFHRPSSFG